MKRVLSVVAAGAIALAMGASAQAQVVYGAPAPVGVVTSPYVYGYSPYGPAAAPVYVPAAPVATTYYRPGLFRSSVVTTAPGAVSYYSSGYQGYVAPAAPVYTAPAYGYSVVSPSVYVVPRRPLWRRGWGW
jgi:hypothetical protein